MYTIGQGTHGLVDLDAHERRRHMYVIGKTGTGKSTLLENLASYDLEMGRGFALIDPHGDLSKKVANIVPKNRTNDTIYFDPLDPHFSPGFNIVADVSVPDIVSSFKNIFKDSWGPRLEFILSMSLYLLKDNAGTNLLHVPLVLTEPFYRKKLLRHCTDPFVRWYWTRRVPEIPKKDWESYISPIENKIGQVAMNPHLRFIFGQPSTINFDEIMNSGKIFIANLSKGQMGAEPAHLLGALLATAFAQAAQRRSVISEEDREDFTLYVDEFQNFATSSFSEILSEARKYRLNLVLANQFVAQLPEELKQGVLGNVGTLVVFRVGSQDADLLADEIGLPDHAGVSRQLSESGNGQAYVKRMAAEYDVVKTIKYEFEGSRLEAVRRRTQSRYSRRKEVVEEQNKKLFN